MEATAPIQDSCPHPDERKFLVNALLQVAERENRRIGQELHDHLCQVLIGAAFAAKAVALQLPADGPAVQEVDDLVRMISSAAQQTRAIAQSLNPAISDSADLVAALEHLVAIPRAGFVCRLECSAPMVVPEGSTALHLGRIASEAIANAVQHSGGSEITVRLTADSEGLCLQIHDNGHGFDLLPDKAAGLGIPLMKYRAETIGGRLRFDAREEGGTCVICAVPK